MLTFIPSALQPHACRVCFGRILTVKQDDGKERHVCTECETAVVGRVHDLCCCGVKLATGKNAGLRCEPNPNKSPENPAAFIIKRIED